jgi:hypothetical protein
MVVQLHNITLHALNERKRLHEMALNEQQFAKKETKLGRNTQNIYLKHRYLLNKNVMPEITYELLNKISNHFTICSRHDIAEILLKLGFYVNDLIDLCL